MAGVRAAGQARGSERPSGVLGAAHRGCGQETGSGSCVDRRAHARVETQRGLGPDRTRNRGGSMDTKSDRRHLGCFERRRPCGVCDRNNLRSNLRRGRLPSDWLHSLRTCPANGLQIFCLAGLYLISNANLFNTLTPQTGRLAPTEAAVGLGLSMTAW
jgi:hypothetical protein